MCRGCRRLPARSPGSPHGSECCPVLPAHPLLPPQVQEVTTGPPIHGQVMLFEMCQRYTSFSFNKYLMRTYCVLGIKRFTWPLVSPEPVPSLSSALGVRRVKQTPLPRSQPTPHVGDVGRTSVPVGSASFSGSRLRVTVDLHWYFLYLKKC